jgi:predicted alpha/beta hydrolase family esterase
MSQIILLHGDHATSQDNWLPYVAGAMADQGRDVVSPNIPDSEDLDLERWLDYLDDECTLTSDTVLVGHSSGCPVILSLLEQSPVRIKKVVLVAGFMEDIGFGVAPILQESYDWKQIKQNCEEFIFVNSDNDPYNCDDTQGRKMLDLLGGTQVIIAGAMHFGTDEYDDVCEEFPLLVKLIED